MTRRLIVTLLVAALALPAAADGTAEVGDRVRLEATHEDGVPVHPVPEGTNRFFRVPDGSVAEVVEVHPGNGWLRLVFDDGRTGWITPRRYLERVLEGPHGDDDREPEPATEAERVWGSPAGCAEVLGGGGRLGWEEGPEASLRLATWNVRWFPRGCAASSSCPDNATDVDWLACTIAWMDLDLVALQEILDTVAGRRQMEDLAGELDELTGGSWAADLQGCGDAGAQRVGFLWDTTRLALDRFADACQLNGAACTNPCVGHLRPGRYARVASRREGGADFHLVSVHLDSGRRDRDFDHRHIASERIPHLAVDGEPLLSTDGDVVVLGDFNTMGRGEPPEIPAADEITMLDETLGAGFRRLEPDPGCSEYFRGHGGLLDHVVASVGMREVEGGSRVSGYCAVAECEPLAGGEPPAYHVLSDHCPVVFAVRDEDLDVE